MRKALVLLSAGLLLASCASGVLRPWCDALAALVARLLAFGARALSYGAEMDNRVGGGLLVAFLSMVGVAVAAWCLATWKGRE